MFGDCLGENEIVNSPDEKNQFVTHLSNGLLQGRQPSAHGGTDCGSSRFSECGAVNAEMLPQRALYADPVDSRSAAKLF